MDPLWAALINSDWRDHLGSGRREDRIGNDRWLADFLDRIGWLGSSLPGQEERERLRRLRGLLRRMTDALLERRPIAEEDLAALNRVLSDAPAIRRLERADGEWSLDLVQPRGDLADALGAIATSFAELLAEGDPSRVKECENRDCRWVMVDESRNRSRRWCDSAECGNVMKVRRFRRRQRAARGA